MSKIINTIVSTLLLGIVLLWTNPVDKDKWLKARLFGWITGSKNTYQLAYFDSMRSGAKESTNVNVGCIHMPQTWNFMIQIIDSSGNISAPSNIDSVIILPHD